LVLCDHVLYLVIVVPTACVYIPPELDQPESFVGPIKVTLLQKQLPKNKNNINFIINYYIFIFVNNKKNNK
jgi:hypothetical protein